MLCAACWRTIKERSEYQKHAALQVNFKAVPLFKVDVLWCKRGYITLHLTVIVTLFSRLLSSFSNSALFSVIQLPILYLLPQWRREINWLMQKNLTNTIQRPAELTEQVPLNYQVFRKVDERHVTDGEQRGQNKGRTWQEKRWKQARRWEENNNSGN
jgi:hypothetical protein